MQRNPIILAALAAALMGGEDIASITKGGADLEMRPRRRRYPTRSITDENRTHSGRIQDHLRTGDREILNERMVEAEAKRARKNAKRASQMNRSSEPK